MTIAQHQDQNHRQMFLMKPAHYLIKTDEPLTLLVM
jgi:hypothetical protein